MKNIENKKTKDNSIEDMSNFHVSEQERKAKLEALLEDGRNYIKAQAKLLTGNLSEKERMKILFKDNDQIIMKFSMFERVKRKEAKRKAKKMAMRKTKRKAQTKARRVNRKGKV